MAFSSHCSMEVAFGKIKTNGGDRPQGVIGEAVLRK
jgi:hypothetical protein